MEQKGDFLGFEFAGVHSSTLNIIRTSDGDRFDEEILPEIKDITVEVPGMDGEYYFGSTYGPRTFEISIAFNHLTESDFRKLRKVYGRKQIGELIFDERPYKKYMVKIESPISLSYICFDEPKYEWRKIQVGTEQVVDGSGNTITQPVYQKGIEGSDYEYKEYDGTTQRIYKGEGTINFVSYFPFAKSCFKVLDTDELKNNDWAVSSGILKDTERGNIDKYVNGSIIVYNAGDVPTGFCLYIPMEKVAQGLALSYEYSGAQPTEIIPQLIINPVEPKSIAIEYHIVDNPSGSPVEQGWYEFINYNYKLSTDTEVQSNKVYYTQENSTDIGILIDTNNGLITGVSSININQDGNITYTTSGNIYNEYINSGYFFHLQPDDRNIVTTSTITFDKDATGSQIFYDYLYF